MSRIFEALQQSAREPGNHSNGAGTAAKVPEPISSLGDATSPLRSVPTFSIPASPEKRLVAITDRLGFGAEKLRMLSARVKYALHRAGLKRLLITSTIVAEGKTTITANLGIMLAQQRQQVLLIDGDVHQSALSGLFGLGSRPGLAEWWQRQGALDGFIYRADGLPLWVLPSGKTIDQPLAMLHSGEFQQLIQGISNRFDWVIIDSPPLAPLADAGTWATIADSILLVTRKAVTPKKLLEQSLSALDRSKLVGVVLNDAAVEEERYYAKYYDHSGHRRKPSVLPDAGNKR